MVEMETTVICDKNDILLTKSFTEDEDEKFTITFKCNYDEGANIIKIIRKCKFYELLYKLNSDLVNDFSYIKNGNNTGGNGIFYFKEKYEGEYMCMSFNDTIKCHSDDHISIEGVDNNITDFKQGYRKFDVSHIYTDVELKDGKVLFHFSTIITSDDLVNDIIAMMIKKQMFRLRKYLEKE